MPSEAFLYFQYEMEYNIGFKKDDELDDDDKEVINRFKKEYTNTTAKDLKVVREEKRAELEYLKSEYAEMIKPVEEEMVKQKAILKEKHKAIYDDLSKQRNELNKEIDDNKKNLEKEKKPLMDEFKKNHPKANDTSLENLAGRLTRMFESVGYDTNKLSKEIDKIDTSSPREKFFAEYAKIFAPFCDIDYSIKVKEDQVASINGDMESYSLSIHNLEDPECFAYQDAVDKDLDLSWNFTVIDNCFDKNIVDRNKKINDSEEELKEFDRYIDLRERQPKCIDDVSPEADDCIKDYIQAKEEYRHLPLLKRILAHFQNDEEEGPARLRSKIKGFESVFKKCGIPLSDVNRRYNEIMARENLENNNEEVINNKVDEKVQIEVDVEEKIVNEKSSISANKEEIINTNSNEKNTSNESKDVSM